jgi:hypothetical protein
MPRWTSEGTPVPDFASFEEQSAFWAEHDLPIWDGPLPRFESEEEELAFLESYSFENYVRGVTPEKGVSALTLLYEENRRLRKVVAELRAKLEPSAISHQPPAA